MNLLSLSKKNQTTSRSNQSKTPTQQRPSSENSRKSKKQPKVSAIQLFRFATRIEVAIIIFSALLSAISGSLPVVAVLLYGSFVSSINTDIKGNEQVIDSILPFIQLMLVMGTAAIVTAYVSTCLWIRIGERQARRIRALYLHSIIRQDMSWFDKAKDDSLLTRLAIDTQYIQDGISEKFGLCIMYFCQLIAGFGVSFYRGYKMALIMFAICPILAVITWTMIVLIKKYMIQTHVSYAQAGSVAEQALRSIRTVHSFSLQERFLKRFQEKLKVAKSIGIKRIYVSGIGNAMFMFCFFSSLGLTLWYGSQLVLEGKATASSVLVVFLSMKLGSTAIPKMLPYLTIIANACGASYKIFKVIDTIPVIDCDNNAGEKLAHVKGAIVFKHVNFAYASRPDVPVLHDISLEITPGMTVACVGSSGSGKSTIVQLIQRFYDPIEGQITLDGHDLRNLNVKWLRQSVGVVGQMPVLFNVSIRENIQLGSPFPVSDNDIIAAAKEANCHNFIKQLPQGYDTIVGEHGGTLSGGQRQRIAIARAIIKNPKILLLDEATSALDTQSERIVQHALDNASASRTTVIVAHRLSTIAKADKIVVIDQGHIVEVGTHQELISQDGMYADLVRKQSIDTEKDQDVPFMDEKNIELVESTTDQKLEDKSQLDSDLTKVETTNSSKSTDLSVSSDISDTKTVYYEKGTPQSISKQVVTTSQRDKTKYPSTWGVVKRMQQESKLIAFGIFGSLLQGSILPLYGYAFSSVIGLLSDANYHYAPPMQGTNFYGFMLFIIGLVAFIGVGLSNICFSLTGEYFTYRLRGQIFKAYMKQEVAFFDKKENNTGILTTNLATHACSVSDMVSKVWGDVISLFSSLVTGLVIAFMHSWALSLITLGITPFIALSTTLDMYLQRSFDDKTKNGKIQSSQIAGEAIREVKTVAALGQQSYFEERYAKATELAHQLEMKKAYFSSIGFSLFRGLTIYAKALAFYVGTRLLISGSIQFNQLFVSMTVLLITAEAAGRNSMFATILAKGKYSARAIFDLLDRRPNLIDVDLEGVEPKLGTIQGEVKFENIKFAYPERSESLIFDGHFNLDIKPGQTIALVGPSGCGKSTTIGLLQRWYDVLENEGSVSVDQKNVKSYSLHNLRSHMSIVGQEPVLFNMSIGENIRYGVDEDAGHLVTQTDIENAAKSANVHHFIESLPQGYNTFVGNSGSQLSGGQKQRISIARAILRKPKILLLDEATSALDSESEKLVQEALDQIIQDGKKTTITIAHRLSTIVNADVICVLKNGRIKEQGTHKELLALNGIYSKLIAEQSLTPSE